MIRKIAIVMLPMMVAAGIMVGCKSSNNGSNLVGPINTDSTRTVILSEGFEGNLSKYDDNYMITVGDFYPKMRITTAEAHSGTHSITSDSNRCALLYEIKSRVETGIAGAEFYIFAKAAGQTNFTVEIGQNAGSSGGLGKAFGLGFDQSDSVKCTYLDLDTMDTDQDTMIAPIQLKHWYKCIVEVDFNAYTITWYLDNIKVRTKPFPLKYLYGIDRMLIFRGTAGADGAKPYYADDIILYSK